MNWEDLLPGDLIKGHFKYMFIDPNIVIEPISIVIALISSGDNDEIKFLELSGGKIRPNQSKRGLISTNWIISRNGIKIN